MRVEREPKTRAVSDYEDEVLRSLRRIIRAVDLYSRRLLHRYGLSSPQLLCLRQLVSQGPMPAGRLATAMNLSPATVSGILDRLEARGLVKRTRETADKRRVLVELSPEGAALAGSAPSPLQEGFLNEFRALSAREQADISRALKRLVTMMAADELDAAPLLAPGTVGEPPLLAAAPSGLPSLPEPKSR